jgi:hypothetical protein
MTSTVDRVRAREKSALSGKPETRLEGRAGHVSYKNHDPNPSYELSFQRWHMQSVNIESPSYFSILRQEPEPARRIAL